MHFTVICIACRILPRGARNLAKNFWFKPDEKISEFLKSMLISKMEGQWGKFYNDASKCVESDRKNEITYVRYMRNLHIMPDFI